MSDTSLSDWQARFFEERVATPSSGPDGVYFREQVFGALEVLSGALPEVEEALGTQNFRFFVRELLATTQPTDSMGVSLITPFLDFLASRPELAEIDTVQAAIQAARKA